MAQRHRAGKRTLINIGKMLVSVVLVYILLQKIGLQTIWQHMGEANWWWALLGLVTFAISNILGALQWHLLLRAQKVDMSFGHVVSFYHVGLFFNNFLIGYVGGDAFRIYDVSKHSGDSTVAVSSVVFDRLVGFFMLTSIAMVMALLWMKKLDSIRYNFYI